MVILITGGAGFIGSNLIHYWLAQNPGDTIVNFDALTYAGNLANLAGVESNPNYHFFQGDLRKQEQLDEVFEQFSIDSVIHLAAESHVDRSINDPSPFIDSNIKGTFQLLETARTHWQEDLNDHRFLHVSTDEVYGTLGKEGLFTEQTPFAPNSPYSTAKASSHQTSWHSRMPPSASTSSPPTRTRRRRGCSPLSRFRPSAWCADSAISSDLPSMTSRAAGMQWRSRQSSTS